MADVHYEKLNNMLSDVESLIEDFYKKLFESEILLNSAKCFYNRLEKAKDGIETIQEKLETDYRVSKPVADIESKNGINAHETIESNATGQEVGNNAAPDKYCGNCEHFKDETSSGYGYCEHLQVTKYCGADCDDWQNKARGSR